MKQASLKLVLAAAVVGTAAVFGANGNWPWTRWSDIATTAPILVTSSFRVVSDTLRTGESVATLLDRQGITGLNLQSLAIALSFDPKRIKAGLVFSVHRDGVTDEATRVEFRPNPDHKLQFIRTSGGWTGQADDVRWKIDTVRAYGEIHTTLYDAFDDQISEATLDYGERMKLANNFADMNQCSKDFSQSQPGDEFAVIYERKVSEEGEVRLGNILASEVVVDSEVHTEFPYSVTEGKTSYYDGKGNACAVLAAPLHLMYVTSRFSSARMHPILGLMRRHEGTDYGAARGTPVDAAGDGVVTVAGWSGGYGKMVEIKHNKNGVVTRYGHLDQVLTRVGAHVSQGDLIGRVGSTGLATGPHLHYEFRVGGIARDPASAKKLTGDPIPPIMRSDFLNYRDRMMALLGPTLRGRTTTVTE